MEWLGWIVPRPLFNRPPRPESLTPPAAEDLARIEELRLRGSALELPHPVRAFVRFEREAGARGAADSLAADGYRCQVRWRGPDTWVLTAISELVPAPARITHFREQIEARASPYGGEFTGWTAPVVHPLPPAG